MTEPRRLLDGEGTGLERELLSLTGGEAMPVELSARMAAGFAGALDGLALLGDGGVTAATGGDALATGAAGGETLATGAAGGAASHMGAGAGAAGVTTGKLWLLSGAGAAKAGLAGLAIVGGVFGVNLALEPEEDSRTDHQVPELPARAAPLPEVSEPEAAPHSETSALEAPERQGARGQGTLGESLLEDSTITAELKRAKKKTARAARVQRKSQAAPARATSTLGAELALLDEVRALIAAGKRSQAQRRLRAYGRRFPQGVLKAEAAVLAAAARKGGASKSSR